MISYQGGVNVGITCGATSAEDHKQSFETSPQAEKNNWFVRVCYRTKQDSMPKGWHLSVHTGSSDAKSPLNKYDVALQLDGSDLRPTISMPYSLNRRNPISDQCQLPSLFGPHLSETWCLRTNTSRFKCLRWKAWVGCVATAFNLFNRRLGVFHYLGLWYKKYEVFISETQTAFLGPQGARFEGRSRTWLVED